eukprot:69005_1
MDEKDITLPTQSQDAGPVDSEQIRMRFHCNELMQLLDIEAVCNEYLGKDVGVVVQNKADIYYGKLNIISADGYVYLEHVNWDFDDEYQPGAMFHILKIQKVSLVDTDCLIENSSKYKESKDITQHILDAIKLKTTHDVLHYIGPVMMLHSIGPLMISNRKTYLDKHSSPNLKRVAGDSIVNWTKLSLDMDALDTDLSQWIKLWIEQHTTPRYHLYSGSAAFAIHHIVALLYYYHQLWKKHIVEHDDDVDIECANNIITKRPSHTNYMDWDDKSEMRYNSIMNAPQARNVHIESIWPYGFFGPCTKSKKNHLDWMCMNCKQNVQINSDQFVFYKARRRDITMEICQQCVVKQNKTIIRKVNATGRRQHISFPEPCPIPYCRDCMDGDTVPVPYFPMVSRYIRPVQRMPVAIGSYLRPMAGIKANQAPKDIQNKFSISVPSFGLLPPFSATVSAAMTTPWTPVLSGWQNTPDTPTQVMRLINCINAGN